MSPEARATALLDGTWEDSFLREVPEYRHQPSTIDMEWIVEAHDVLHLLLAELARARQTIQAVEEHAQYWEDRANTWEDAVANASHATEECEGRCMGERGLIAEQIRALAASSAGDCVCGEINTRHCPVHNMGGTT